MWTESDCGKGVRIGKVSERRKGKKDEGKIGGKKRNKKYVSLCRNMICDARLNKVMFSLRKKRLRINMITLLKKRKRLIKRE